MKQNKMKNIILALLLSAISLNSFSQFDKSIENPFSYLSELKINENYSIFYDPTISEIIELAGESSYEKFNEIIGCYPECDMLNTQILKTKIDRNSDTEFYVFFGVCTAPLFYFLKVGETNIHEVSISEEKVFITGQGAIYTKGHFSRDFEMSRKYKIINNSIVEITQPFYYVGLKTKTLNPITLFFDKELKNKIANLPKDYKIEVLVMESIGKDRIYLIRTSFGLTGWAKIRTGQYHSIDVDGLEWHGN